MFNQWKAVNYPQNHQIDNIIDVNTGEVKTGIGSRILRSNAIGSCIAVAVYDPRSKAGGLAHIMLPGASREGNTNTKYAQDAIHELLRKMSDLGVKKDKLTACIVGGGNVLRRKNEILCLTNINYVTKLLKQERIPVMAKSLGGLERRTLTLDLNKGTVKYTVGNRAEDILWIFKAEKPVTE
ncbi:MAG: chemotaxis protein CheD [Fidelibacterota bacterium]